jgi:hypothetical protein
VCWVSRHSGTNIGTTLKHYARYLPDDVQERNLVLLNGYFQVTPVSEVGQGDEAR